MFEITRNVMRITFANYFADIDEQLKEILQYRDARAFHTAHPVEKVRKDDKNDDPSSESTTAAATVKPTVTVMSNPTSPLSAVVAKSKGRAFQVDQRSALIAAAYPTLHELVKECYTKRVGYDDFFPQSLR